MSLYLVLDPGLKNTAAALVRVTGCYPEAVVCVLYKETVSLAGNVNPDKNLAQQFCVKMLSIAKRYLKENVDLTVVVEFQPPINIRSNPAIVRWNSWIEGYVVAFFSNCDWKTKGVIYPHVSYVHSNAVKQFYGIRTGSYRKNKQLALATAKRMTKKGKNCVSVDNDHEADCVLMALYKHSKLLS